MKKLIRFIVVLLIAAIIIGWGVKDNIIRSYVSLCRDKLESYTTQLLEDSKLSELGEKMEFSYGAFKTYCYPKEGMVEFYTSGFGLVSSSTYKGFYYSADDTHKVFGAASGDDITMEIDGDRASWTDGTDNHGISVRIAEKWFWFEASF